MFENIDTVTLYISASLQAEFYDYIIDLNPVHSGVTSQLENNKKITRNPQNCQKIILKRWRMTSILKKLMFYGLGFQPGNPDEPMAFGGLRVGVTHRSGDGRHVPYSGGVYEPIGEGSWGTAAYLRGYFPLEYVRPPDWSCVGVSSRAGLPFRPRRTGTSALPIGRAWV